MARWRQSGLGLLGTAMPLDTTMRFFGTNTSGTVFFVGHSR